MKRVLLLIFAVFAYAFYPSDKGDVFKFSKMKKSVFSDDTAVFCSEISGMMYGDDVSLENFLKLNRFENIQISTTNTTNVKYLIAKRDDVLLIAFRGTDNNENVFVDTDTQPEIFENNSSLIVHGGFLKAEESFEKEFLSTDYSDNIAKYKFIITGHSLGGAIAQLFAAKLIYKYGADENNVTVYAFGSPGVGNEEFVKFFNNMNAYLVNEYYDAVPYLTKESFIEFIKSYMTLLNMISEQLAQYVQSVDNFYEPVGDLKIVKDFAFVSQGPSYSDMLNNYVKMLTAHDISNYIESLKVITQNFSSDVIHLRKGWNLVGFGECEFDGGIVWSYDNGIWYTNYKGIGYPLIDKMHSYKGYWVYVNEDKDLNVSDCFTAGAVELSQGWNLVSNVSGSYLDIFDKIDGELIWRYEEGEWSLLIKDNNQTYGFAPIDVLEEHDGFWIKK